MDSACGSSLRPRNRRIVRDLAEAFPGIDSTPDVPGGEARIVRTRIPVWVLVQARRLGATEADLLRSYPTLRAKDLTNAWAYTRVHHDEIEQQILENETALVELRRAQYTHGERARQHGPLVGGLRRVIAYGAAHVHSTGAGLLDTSVGFRSSLYLLSADAAISIPWNTLGWLLFLNGL